MRRMLRQAPTDPLLRNLRSRWALFLFLGLFCIACFYYLLVEPHSSDPERWLIVASLVFAGQAILFYFDLEKNHTLSSTELLPGFGIGTWLSALRLLLLSLLAGFLLSSRSEGTLAWAPFWLYLAFNLMDLIDGYAARRSGQVTRLGEKLDLDLDSRGMLAGALVAIQLGATGWWYALVGLARYVYVGALWFRRRSGLKASEQPNPNSRPLAGLQMGVNTALLAPALMPPFTTCISALALVPFLANFFYDWLVAVGKVPAVKKPWLPASVRGAMGLSLRVLVFALLVYRALATDGGAVMPFELLLGAMLLLGAGARIISLVLLVRLGISLGGNSPDMVEWLTILASWLLVYTGAGWLGLWAPENSLIRGRLGEQGR